MPVARPHTAGPNRISLLLVVLLLGSPTAVQAEGKHPEGPGPEGAKLLWLTAEIGGSQLVRGHTRHPLVLPDSGLGASSLTERGGGGGDASEGLPPWSAGLSSLGLGTGPLLRSGGAPRSGVLFKPPDSGSSVSATAPGAGCQVFLSLSKEEDRYRKGPADLTACHQNQGASHPAIPCWLGLSGRAIPWIGPNQVSRTGLGCGFLWWRGAQVSRNLERREMSEPQGLGSFSPLYSLDSLVDVRNEEGVLVKSTCLLVRKEV